MIPGNRKKKHNRMTISPDCFLPFYITEEPREFINGKIILSPIMSSTEIDIFLRELEGKYPAPGLDSGYILNLGEIFTVSTSIYPMPYKAGSFSKIDKRFAGLGSTAVVILNPMEYIDRLQRAVAINFPNLRFLEVGSIQYNDEDHWSLYSRSNAEAWKQEFLISAKLNAKLIFESSQYAQPVMLNIGDLSQIAIAVSVKDLIDGNFPPILYDSELIKYLDSYIPLKRGVQNYSFSVMADVQDIVPDKKWMSLLGSALGDDWSANTSIERLFTDGDALPRLVYHYKNRIDKLHIGINRMDITFAHYGNHEKCLLENVLRIIDKELGLRYCRMSVSTNANLGTATENIALNNAFVKETKIKIHKGLQVTHDIETDYCISHNVLGIESSQRAWHYVITTETPKQELTIWYRLQDVIDFFEEASDYNETVINKLLRGKAYAGFKKI